MEPNYLINFISGQLESQLQQFVNFRIENFETDTEDKNLVSPQISRILLSNELLSQN